MDATVTPAAAAAAAAPAPLVPPFDASDVGAWAADGLGEFGREMAAAMGAGGPADVCPAFEDEKAVPSSLADSDALQPPPLPAAAAGGPGPGEAATAAALLAHCVRCRCSVVQRYTHVSAAARAVHRLEVHVNKAAGTFHALLKAAQGDGAEELAACAAVDAPPEGGEDAAAWAECTLLEGAIVLFKADPRSLGLLHRQLQRYCASMAAAGFEKRLALGIFTPSGIASPGAAGSGAEVGGAAASAGGAAGGDAPSPARGVTTMDAAARKRMRTAGYAAVAPSTAAGAPASDVEPSPRKRPARVPSASGSNFAERLPAAGMAYGALVPGAASPRPRSRARKAGPAAASAAARVALNASPLSLAAAEGSCGELAFDELSAGGLHRSPSCSSELMSLPLMGSSSSALLVTPPHAPAPAPAFGAARAKAARRGAAIGLAAPPPPVAIPMDLDFLVGGEDSLGGDPDIFDDAFFSALLGIGPGDGLAQVSAAAAGVAAAAAAAAPGPHDCHNHDAPAPLAAVSEHLVVALGSSTAAGTTAAAAAERAAQFELIIKEAAAAEQLPPPQEQPRSMAVECGRPESRSPAALCGPVALPAAQLEAPAVEIEVELFSASGRPLRAAAAAKAFKAHSPSRGAGSGLSEATGAGGGAADRDREASGDDGDDEAGNEAECGAASGGRSLRACRAGAADSGCAAGGAVEADSEGGSGPDAFKINTSIHELVKHFHLPINDAAAALAICPTVLKKICRRHGLPRWPYRKVRSIDRNIETLQASLDALLASGGCGGAGACELTERDVLRRELECRLAGLAEERAKLCLAAPARPPVHLQLQAGLLVAEAAREEDDEAECMHHLRLQQQPAGGAAGQGHSMGAGAGPQLDFEALLFNASQQLGGGMMLAGDAAGESDVCWGAAGMGLGLDGGYAFAAEMV